LQLDQNVIFTGFRADVGAFLNILSLLAVPSIEEGLNSSILDALALEIPVVATDAGGISEIITHAETGILVPPGNADALTSAILHVLASPEQAKSMARRGSQQVRVLFSAQSMVEKNIAVYQNLLEGNVTKGVLAV
jgi:glycosyltransferase involved in cell wall biosynthesis